MKVRKAIETDEFRESLNLLLGMYLNEDEVNTLSKKARRLSLIVLLLS